MYDFFVKVIQLGRKFIVSHLFTFCNYFYEKNFCFYFPFWRPKKEQQKTDRKVGGGAGNEIWTRDIHLGKVTLYRWAIPAYAKKPIYYTTSFFSWQAFFSSFDKFFPAF